MKVIRGMFRKQYVYLYVKGWQWQWTYDPAEATHWDDKSSVCDLWMSVVSTEVECLVTIDLDCEIHRSRLGGNYVHHPLQG